ncbi:MAG TPA: hypothetical protein PKG77_16890 [Phycisphaerae bacterium]|nr:hypothetical protein [Phycisphaerae bacterium]HQL73506.1 hypothetical protein [Phycisphaerae bacterium]
MSRIILSIACAAGLLGGCEKPVSFPALSLDEAAKAAGAWQAFDTNGDGKADFFLLADATGRVDRIAYDRDGDQKGDEIVNLDHLRAAQCRHLVIVLDGFGHDVVKAFRDEGHFRMFHPPSRLITVYPSMTDMAMEEIFDSVPCPAYEALYYDRRRNKLAGGSLPSRLAADRKPHQAARRGVRPLRAGHLRQLRDQPPGRAGGRPGRLPGGRAGQLRPGRRRGRAGRRQAESDRAAQGWAVPL